ncbi:Zinc finger protein 3 [Amphibalanus amphitrite]|uniref:Zinc finger protein 3 n=1 Tax=Amphibalanus amphitrite TaxID=1232801 RepID=A0A6A4WHT4_AMPAM|nr:Zinc finger protein 3 [Amphibalanus amphitrite]
MRRFTQKRIVEYHMRTHESSRRRGRTVKKGNRLKKENGELEDIKDSPGPGPVKYTCEECGAGFDTRRRFIRHQQMRHDAEAPRYECEVCSATYTRIDELTRHSIQIHHQKKTVPCPRCTRLFTQQRIVDYHVRGHDTKRVYNRVPRPHRCDTCQRSFSTEALLMRHNCRDKTSTQRCVCDICGRGVSCPQALRRHRLQHLEERPAKCDTCGAAFIDDVALSKHVLTHSDEKPFLCDHCGKGFRFKDYLVRHTRFHTGERPYPCSACDKRFATSDTLHRHFLIHTGEKPYVCEMCGRPFRQAQQLKTHMKIHNKYSPSFTIQQGSSQRGRSFANAKPAASAPTQPRLTELTNASGAPEVPATGAALLVADESGQLRLVEEGHADVTLQEIHTFETQVLPWPSGNILEPGRVTPGSLASAELEPLVSTPPAQLVSPDLAEESSSLGQERLERRLVAGAKPPPYEPMDGTDVTKTLDDDWLKDGGNSGFAVSESRDRPQLGKTDGK